eukprot:1618761-Amphidinium_carterae.1
MSRCKDSLWPFSFVRLSATFSSWGNHRNSIRQFTKVFWMTANSNVVRFSILEKPSLFKQS